MRGDLDETRSLIRVGGEDRESFLQALVTNDLDKLSEGLVYAALLTPQGKYLADFFLVPEADSILIDVDGALAPDLLRRLTLYRLRAKVTIEAVELPVVRGLGDLPEGAFADPRDPALGWRAYGAEPVETAGIDWTALRVAHGIPEQGSELIPDDSYILEFDFERLNGVDFRKGCFVGQEIVARMKHKTTLRKGLARLRIDGAAEPGTEITAGGKTVGRLGTQSGSAALAHVRFDRAQGDMQAGPARVSPLEPQPAAG
ncbi:MAG: folate-binding protein [Pseudomonadota bacterium]